MVPNLVAFTGYSRSGKSSATQVLLELGHEEVSLGSIIKRHLDPLVRHHLGYSAFTENDAEKSHIRPLLEQAGEIFYDSMLNEMFKSLPEKAVNQRLVRVREAIAWREAGGRIYELVRPHICPATDWERERMAELRRSGLIDGIIVNDSTVQELHDQVLRLR